MTVKLLTEHHLEFLSLKVGCKSSPESTLVKMPHCWKSHVVTHMYMADLRSIIVCQYEWKVQRIFTHLSRMEFPTLNQLDQSISVLRVVGWYFSSLFKFY